MTVQSVGAPRMGVARKLDRQNLPHRNWSSTSWVLLPFCSIFFYFYAAGYSEPPFFSGDAAQYWQLGQSFISEGSFSLLRGEQTFRGYLFPAFLGLIQDFARQTGVNPFQF